MKQETQDVIDLMYEMDNNPIHYAADGDEAVAVFKSVHPSTEYSIAIIKHAWRVGCNQLDEFIQEEFGDEIERLTCKEN